MSNKLNMILPVLFTALIFGSGCWCEEQSKCNDCYLKHYDYKGCTPVYESGSDCPVRFNCPDKQPEDNSVCVFRGKAYKFGEKVDTGNPCNDCKCGLGYSGHSEVTCASGTCPRTVAANATCHMAYRQGVCCPYLECLTDEVAKKTVCEYDGKTYKYGERIYPSGSKHCDCNENYRGPEGSTCTTFGCLTLDLDQRRLQKGCVPIYYEDMCCPIEFLCGEYTEPTTVSLAKKEDIESGNTCVFKDVHYAKGQKLDYLGRDSCVTCSCDTPPDFTCVRKKCPLPPNFDSKNCKRDYTPGKCCASYHCVL